MKPGQRDKIMEINCITNPDRVKEIGEVLYGNNPTKYQIQDAYRYLERGDCFRKLEEEYVLKDFAKLPIREIISLDLLKSTKVKAVAKRRKVSIRQAERTLKKPRQPLLVCSPPMAQMLHPTVK